MKIIVMSCDKNVDLFEPYHYCMEKYWPEHPEIIFCTETKENKYYKTICSQERSWGLRLKDCLNKIDDNCVLLTLDDIFIRKPVNNQKVLELCNKLSSVENIGFINFEGEFRSSHDSYDELCNSFYPQRELYKVSVMLNLFNKKCLEQICDDIGPWDFEKQSIPSSYKYLITKEPVIDFGKHPDTCCNWGIVSGKWTIEAFNFFKSEKFDIDYNDRGFNLKKSFGIISYLSEEKTERESRQKRLERLVGQLSDLWPDIPIIIIAQQWGDFSLEGKCKNKIYKYSYPALGIIKARQTLRERFLELGFDYLIMFDDDAIIEYSQPMLPKYYMDTVDRHPDGFCFILGDNNKYCPYAGSQLNLCAISRSIYLNEPMPDVDAQKSQGFEDRIFSTLLHYKYADKEFDAPRGIKCCHYNNPNIKKYGGDVPSTWAREENLNWEKLAKHTVEIEKYISEHKDLPELKVYFEFKELVDKTYDYEKYVRDKKQKLVDLLVSRYPDKVKDVMRDALEKAHGLKKIVAKLNDKY